MTEGAIIPYFYNDSRMTVNLPRMSTEPMAEMEFEPPASRSDAFPPLLYKTISFEGEYPQIKHIS